MDWMYKQSKPESDDYLLGKRVDKHIEEAVETVKDGNQWTALLLLVH